MGKEETMGRPIRFAINGFGRIGRAVARQWVERQADGRFDLVAINDIAPLETCAYLLEFDSVYGTMAGCIETRPDRLLVDGRAVRFSQSPDLAAVDLSDVDVVFECTGKAVTPQFATAGLRAGAQRSFDLWPF